MTPVSNFALSSQNQLEGINTFNFEFDISTDLDIGGYELYIAYDSPATFELAYTIADYKTSQTLKVYNDITTNKSYFSYAGSTVTHKECIGRKLYFYIVSVSTTWVKSIPSSILEVYALPTQVQDLDVLFDNQTVTLMWLPAEEDATLTPLGKNSSIVNYHISRTEMLPISGTTIDATTLKLKNTQFTSGSYIYVVDNKYRTAWFDVITTQGEFKLDPANIYKDLYEKIETYDAYLDNISIFVESSGQSYQLLSIQTALTFTDPTIYKNKMYFYKVSPVDTLNQSAIYSVIPVSTETLSQKIPTLYSIANTNNSLLSQFYWRMLKNVLIDKNYYDKTAYAIPYAKGFYNFKGYIGVANCKVDVYIDDIYNMQTTSNNQGLFEFSIGLKKGLNSLQLQCRDAYNNEFSLKSNKVSVNTVNIYSFFAALGVEYSDMWDEILAQKLDFSLENSRIESFQNKLNSLIDLQQDITEEDAKFRAIGIAIYQSYNYAGYTYALQTVLDAFRDNIDTFDHYEIFSNNSLFSTVKTGNNYVICTSTGLARDNYYYGVTALSDTGEESSPTIIRVDDRWWPTSTGTVSLSDYTGYNVLSWNESPTINRYKVYRHKGYIEGGATPADLQYMGTISGTIYADSGCCAPTSATPPAITFTYFNSPTIVECARNLKVANEFQMSRSSTWMEIIIYATTSMDIPQFQLDRLATVLADIIPPEIGYTLIYANDTITKIL